MECYDNTGLVAFSGEHIPYTGNYFDLDSTYKDPAGDPLLRMTVNWRDNDRKMVEFMTAKGVEIARAMGAREINPNRRLSRLRCDPLSVHPHSGRHDDGAFTRSRRGESIPATLANSQFVCARGLHFSQQWLRQSHADYPRVRVPHRGHLVDQYLKEAGDAELKLAQASACGG